MPAAARVLFFHCSLENTQITNRHSPGRYAIISCADLLLPPQNAVFRMPLDNSRVAEPEGKGSRKDWPVVSTGQPDARARYVHEGRCERDSDQNTNEG